MTRVGVLARARTALNTARQATLETALRQVCEALHAHAEPRSILISFSVVQPALGLSSAQITTLALVVNELATNVIKHAFAAGTSGQVRIMVDRNGGGDVVVTVDDDGLPFAPTPAAGSGALGLGLVRRLIASIDGLLIAPGGASKRFELRVPAHA